MNLGSIKSHQYFIRTFFYSTLVQSFEGHFFEPLSLFTSKKIKLGVACCLKSLKLPCCMPAFATENTAIQLMLETALRASGLLNDIVVLCGLN